MLMRVPKIKLVVQFDSISFKFGALQCRKEVVCRKIFSDSGSVLQV
jgi:hypothetical protein